MSDEGESNQERQAVFQPEFLEDLEYWVETDRKMALRVIKMVKEILRQKALVNPNHSNMSILAHGRVA